MNEDDKIINDLDEYLKEVEMSTINREPYDFSKIYNHVFDKMDEIVDKPKSKKKSSLGPTRAVIDVKQNGYLVIVNGKEYVFNNFDDMSTWMKEHMSPKLDNSDFVDAI